MLNIKNSTKLKLKELEDLLNQLYLHIRNKSELKQEPTVEFVSDLTNSQNPLGKTAYYDPEQSHIVLYVDNRHPKDILRSFSHELVHHMQNMRGDLKGKTSLRSGYAQEDGHLRKMEQEAYLDGNMNFRDWEDGLKSKQKLYESIYQKNITGIRKESGEGNKKSMEKKDTIDLSIREKKWKFYNEKRKETAIHLMEKWGYLKKDGRSFLEESVDSLDYMSLLEQLPEQYSSGQYKSSDLWDEEMLQDIKTLFQSLVSQGQVQPTDLKQFVSGIKTAIDKNYEFSQGQHAHNFASKAEDTKPGQLNEGMNVKLSGKSKPESEFDLGRQGLSKTSPKPEPRVFDSEGYDANGKNKDGMTRDEEKQFQSEFDPELARNARLPDYGSSIDDANFDDYDFDSDLNETVRVSVNGDESGQKFLEEDDVANPRIVNLKPDQSNQMKQELEGRKGESLEDSHYTVGQPYQLEGQEWLVLDYESLEKELSLISPDFTKVAFVLEDTSVGKEPVMESDVDESNWRKKQQERRDAYEAQKKNRKLPEVQPVSDAEHAKGQEWYKKTVAPKLPKDDDKPVNSSDDDDDLFEESLIKEIAPIPSPRKPKETLEEALIARATQRILDYLKKESKKK